jgi:lipoyl(octanoyl) transferase
LASNFLGGPYAPATWRLIVDGEADGATNMAVDEAILAAVCEGLTLPTLRFYAWSPPCLSLGRGQSVGDLDLAACHRAGVQMVRRPSGGRAILHTDELTYSVAMLETDPRASGDVVDSYRRLSEGLLAGLHFLGVDAVQAVSPSQSGGDLSAACFEASSHYEIAAGGRKLIGSAQWRSRNGVLQHGSLPLLGDITRIVDYLNFSALEREAQRRSLRARATTLATVLGRALSFSQAAEGLTRGFAQALSLTLVPGGLTAYERRLADELRQARFANPDWTARR